MANQKSPYEFDHLRKRAESLLEEGGAKVTQADDHTAEVEELQRRLEEAEQTIEAIRNGEVDAVIVGSVEEGSRVYTLEGPDHPYRNIVETMNAGAVSINEQGVIFYSNHAFSDMTGIPLKNLIGSLLMDLVKSEDLPSFLDFLKRSREEDKTTAEIALETTKGKLFVRLSGSSQAVHDLHQTCIVIADISERKAVEESFRQQAELLEVAHDAIIVSTLDNHILWWNRGAEQLYGYSKDEAIGKHSPTLLKTRSPISLDQIASTVKKKGHWEGEFVRVGKDGREIVLLSRWGLQSDGHGNPLAIMDLSLDITEHKRMEEQLRQAHKMEAIGTLAGGIAHDFNNMLAVILGNAELAIDDVSDDDGVHRNLEAIFKAAKRGRDLVKQILTFSRKNEQQQKDQSLTPLIEESFSLLRASIPSTIDMKLTIATKSDVARVNDAQFQQILVNLCTNAAHAMRENGGLIEISLENETLYLDDSSKPRQRYLKLSVRDTGTGMDEDVRRRIFDPFFTTKGPGEGTGMGLAVVYGIVEAHNGLITVQSEPGRGSVFNVFLPKINGTAAAEAGAPKTAVSGGEERIMFVDDEDGIVDIATSILDRLGYEVSPFTDPEAALDAFGKAPHAFDLVITDQTMPKMTGATLAKKLKSIKPDIPIMLCTGYSDTVSADNVKDRGIDGYVMKPLAKRELAEAIRKVLDQGGGVTVY